MEGNRNDQGAPALRGALSRAVGMACAAIGGVGAFLFAAVAVVMVVQALARAIGVPVVGGDEIAGWLSASAAFCALPYAFRAGALIRMELVLSRLRGEQLRRAELCAIVIGTLFCATMAFAMARFVWENALFGERSSGLISIPIWPVQAPAVVGLVLLALAMAEQLVTVWRGERPVYVVAAESTLSSDDRHSAGI
jgi:TRAP-type C4-dicarboxylate transport system permease small subunit